MQRANVRSAEMQSGCNSRNHIAYSAFNAVDGICDTLGHAFDHMPAPGFKLFRQALDIIDAVCHDAFHPVGHRVLHCDHAIFQQRYDFSADLQIKRCDFNGENTETIAEFNNNVYFSNYDEKCVYFHDDNSYYLIDIAENKIIETPVIYQSGRGYEICNGKLYNLLTLEPTVTDFNTGKTELLSMHHT